MTTLYNKYRPQDLHDILGQEEIVTAIARQTGAIGRYVTPEKEPSAWYSWLKKRYEFPDPYLPHNEYNTWRKELYVLNKEITWAILVNGNTSLMPDIKFPDFDPETFQDAEYDKRQRDDSYEWWKGFINNAS